MCWRAYISTEQNSKKTNAIYLGLRCHGASVLLRAIQLHQIPAFDARVKLAAEACGSIPPQKLLTCHPERDHFKRKFRHPTIIFKATY